MQIHFLLEKLRELQDYLEKNDDELIIDLPDQQPIQEIIKTIENSFRNKILSSKKTYNEPKKSTSVISANNKNRENVSCDLCANKMFPVRKYFKLGTKRDVLIVTYNGSYNRLQKKDKSEFHYFNNSKEDQFMLDIFSVKSLSEYSFQELPACHFDANKSLTSDWEKRTQNCCLFLAANIQKYKIQRLVIVGLTALWLFGKEQARVALQMKQRMLVLDNNISIQTLVMYSPTKLLFLKKKQPKQYEIEYNILKKRVKAFGI